MNKISMNFDTNSKHQILDVMSSFLLYLKKKKHLGPYFGLFQVEIILENYIRSYPNLRRYYVSGWYTIYMSLFLMWLKIILNNDSHPLSNT